jgi:hypothetical protein
MDKAQDHTLDARMFVGRKGTVEGNALEMAFLRFAQHGIFEKTLQFLMLHALPEQPQQVASEKRSENQKQEGVVGHQKSRDGL